MEVMNIPLLTELCFTNLHSKDEIKTSCEEVAKKGLSVCISAYQYLLFEIKD
jgi:hypothetical protein